MIWDSLVIGVRPCYEPTTQHEERTGGGPSVGEGYNWRREIHDPVDAICEGRNTLLVGSPGKDTLPLPMAMGRYRHAAPVRRHQ